MTIGIFALALLFQADPQATVDELEARAREAVVHRQAQKVPGSDAKKDMAHLRSDEARNLHQTRLHDVHAVALVSLGGAAAAAGAAGAAPSGGGGGIINLPGGGPTRPSRIAAGLE